MTFFVLRVMYLLFLFCSFTVMRAISSIKIPSIRVFHSISEHFIKIIIVVKAKGVMVGSSWLYHERFQSLFQKFEEIFANVCRRSVAPDFFFFHPEANMGSNKIARIKVFNQSVSDKRFISMIWVPVTPDTRAAKRSNTFNLRASLIYLIFICCSLMLLLISIFLIQSLFTFLIIKIGYSFGTYYQPVAQSACRTFHFRFHQQYFWCKFLLTIFPIYHHDRDHQWVNDPTLGKLSFLYHRG